MDKKELDIFWGGMCVGALVGASLTVMSVALHFKAYSDEYIELDKREDVENSIVYYEDNKTNTQYVLKDGILEVRGLKGE